MPFRVIIVGGSIGGLSLANMLDKFDIEYVLLESHAEFAPQVGASIGILPNGIRILDQIGCYAPLAKAAEEFNLNFSFRNADGRVLARSGLINKKLKHLAQYPFIFLDRQHLLQILYDSIQQKDQLISNARVVQVQLLQDGVQVYTQDGRCFDGDIVVGADGIRSAVRREMHRIAGSESPGYFPQNEESNIVAYNRCIFGISKRPESLPKLSWNMTSNQGSSLVLIAAPDDRTYWTLFDSHQLQRGSQIAKYDKEQEKRLAEAHRNDIVGDDTTFGELYDNGLKTVLTPLEEYCFKKWHYKRIVTIGDAAHKHHPLTGQGGNGAIESAAALVNALSRREDKDLARASTDVIHKVLSEVHSQRYNRAAAFVAEGTWGQGFLNGTTPLSKILLDIVMPWVGEDGIVFATAQPCVSAPRIERLDVVERPHLLPYWDELPEAPLQNIWVYAASWLLCVCILGYTLFTAIFGSDPGSGGHWVGLQAGDAQVAVGSSTRISTILPVYLVWLIDSNRIGRRPLRIFLWITSIALASGIIHSSLVPLLHAFSTVLLGPSLLTSSRFVSPSIVRAVVIAVTISLTTSEFLQNHVASRVNLLLINVLCLSYRRFLLNEEWPPKGQPTTNASTTELTLKDAEIRQRELAINDKIYQDMHMTRDLKYLCITWAISLLACCISCIVAGRLWHTRSPYSCLHNEGHLISSAPTLLYSIWCLWDLRVQGYLTTEQSMLALFAGLILTSMFGPGAAMLAFQWYRELRLASLTS